MILCVSVALFAAPKVSVSLGGAYDLMLGNNASKDGDLVLGSSDRYNANGFGFNADVIFVPTKLLQEPSNPQNDGLTPTVIQCHQLPLYVLYTNALLYN